MESDIIEWMRDKLEDQRGELADVLASGGVSSFDNYRHMCGRIVGIDEALSLLHEFEKRFLEDQ